MARTQKNVVNYFPHDSGACTSDTMTVLQSRFGNDGYAFWFKLLEKLASTDGHYLDVSNPTKWHLLLAKTGVNELTGVEIMKLLVEMQAIDKDLWDSKLIWCQKLVDNVSDVYKNRRREVPQIPIPTNHNGLTTDDNSITTGESTQRKKLKKVNNTILPDWIDKELWDGFMEVRKKVKAASTDYALSLIIKDLEKLKASGDDPNEVLKRSIMNSWKGVFPLKGGHDGTHQQRPRALKSREAYLSPEQHRADT